jgi:TetR/AcrR family transcriptional regulator, regulator of cefoperazone and chloramphenicol sensitivity
MSVQTVITLQEGDLTARARIREAALRLFGAAGFGVSVRAIAEAAGTSPALVIHHFGSKEGLREAVDQAVIDAFQQRFAALPSDLPAEELGRLGGEAFGEVVAARPDIRRYLRRSLLDGTAASMTVFDDLVARVRDGLARLDESDAVRPDADPIWRPFQVVFVMLGPLLFEPVIERHMDEPVFAPEVLRRRSAANYDFVARGLLEPEPNEHP